MKFFFAWFAFFWYGLRSGWLWLQESGNRVYRQACLISLHIRSMWETICDAVASWSGWKFGSKFLECPYSSISGMLVWSAPPPPLKMKIWADLGTLSLSWSGVPLPPNENYGGTLSLSWSGDRMWRLIAVSPVDTISFYPFAKGFCRFTIEDKILEIGWYIGSRIFLWRETTPKMIPASFFLSNFSKLDWKWNKNAFPVGCIPPAHWPVSPSMLCSGGCLPAPKGGACLVLGGVCPGPGGAYLVPGEGACLVPGVPAWSRGGALVPGGVMVSHACTEAHHTPCEQNHRRLWKYYLAPTLLRAVKIGLRRGRASLAPPALGSANEYDTCLCFHVVYM